MSLESLKQLLLSDPETKRYYDKLTPEFEKAMEDIKTKRENIKQYYLVKYSSNWADEISIRGLALLTDIDKEWFESLRPTNDSPLIHYVGTNEDIEYWNPEQLLRCYTWTRITREEYELLERLIGTDYGHFFYPQEDDEETEEEGGWV